MLKTVLITAGSVIVALIAWEMFLRTMFIKGSGSWDETYDDLDRG